MEAARYALTRRLLPVLRHHMVVHLQPIGMIYEVLDRKMVAEVDDIAPLREGLTKINTLARSAITSCLDVVSWLAPESSAVTPLGRGVDECIELLASNFRFRGFTVDNSVGAAALPVSQAALREVFTSALMAFSDDATGALKLSVTAQVSEQGAVLSIQRRPGEGSGFTTEMAYRSLSWADVEALAHVHKVLLARTDGVTLSFPACAEPAPAADS
ncbi:MAG: hypothetical protein ABI343_02900 [Burkholderiaceae bacterium]